MCKAPAQGLLPVDTWVGLLLAKELRLYPGLQANVRAPRPQARVAFPLEALKEEVEGKGDW